MELPQGQSTSSTHAYLDLNDFTPLCRGSHLLSQIGQCGAPHLPLQNHVTRTIPLVNGRGL